MKHRERVQDSGLEIARTSGADEELVAEIRRYHRLLAWLGLQADQP